MNYLNFMCVLSLCLTDLLLFGIHKYNVVLYNTRTLVLVVELNMLSRLPFTTTSNHDQPLLQQQVVNLIPTDFDFIFLYERLMEGKQFYFRFPECSYYTIHNLDFENVMDQLGQLVGC